MAGSAQHAPGVAGALSPESVAATARQKLAAEYGPILLDYLNGKGEAALLEAYELGRLAIDSHVDLLEVVSLHRENVRTVLERASNVHELIQLTERADDILKECLAPFEMTLRGFQEAVAALRQLNETLEQRVSERTEALRESERHVRALNANLERQVAERTAQLQDMVDELEALDRKREEFIAAAAHDLKTPITAVRGHAQLLRQHLERERLDSGALDVLIVRPLASIESASRRMERLVHELLDLTRTGMEKSLDLQRQPGDAIELLEGIIQEQQRTTERHRFRFVAREPVLAALWDWERLERVFFNLLDNAIKYMPNGGQVVVSAGSERKDDGVWAVVHVRDEGIGIAPEDLPDIFRRFRRGRNVGRIGGTGIGLSYCREVIEQHGGSIEVQSELNKGTVFSVRLPLNS